MGLRARAAGVALMTAGWLSACSNPFGPRYEYEEQVYLDVDGSATIVIDSSVPALLALRGVRVTSASGALDDRDTIRQVAEEAGCQVTSVARPWSRRGRSYVEITLHVDQVQRAPACALLAWSRYSLERLPDTIRYHQVVGPPTPVDPGPVNWDGSELVAIRMHVPSPIRYHNVRRLADDTPGTIDRGNILTFEQRLTDRRAGRPIDVEIRMDPESILHNTLWMFLGAFVAAVLALVGLVYWLVRKGRRQAAAAGSSTVRRPEV